MAVSHIKGHVRGCPLMTSLWGGGRPKRFIGTVKGGVKKRTIGKETEFRPIQQAKNYKGPEGVRQKVENGNSQKVTKKS